MACTIAINSVVGILPTNATVPTSIVVSGTATGCATGEVKVSIDCGTGTTSVLASVDSSGNWTATFSSNITCACDKPITVTVTCTDGACDATTTVPLRCQPPAPCPKIASFTVSVDGCVGGGANATAVLTVTLTPATSGCSYSWTFGDGSPSVTTTVPTVTHTYTASGTFTAAVVVTCPGQSGSPCVTKSTTSVTIPVCGGCPTVVGLTATVLGCAGATGATVNFSGTLVPPISGCSFLWSFGDGNNQVTTTPSVSHVYAAANTYAVAVTAICPNIPPCSTATIPVTVPRCCPIVTNIVGNIEDNECAGAGAKATFNFSATTDPTSAAGNYTWDFGDGQGVTNPGPNASHDYGVPGTYTVSVEYVPDPAVYPSCPPSTFSISNVNVPACPGTPPGGGGGGGGGGGFGCYGLRVIMTIAAILALVALALAACIPAAATALLWIAAGLGLAAAIAGVLWGIFCKKPCGWGLLLTWQVLIGAGYLLLCFTTCCPVFWVIGPAMIGLGLVLMITWMGRCKKTFCDMYKELVIAISGVLIPALGWLANIPALLACTNHIVTGILSLIALWLTLKALQCNSQMP